MSLEDVIVRPYNGSNEDRKGIEEVMYSTGALGEPLTPIFDDSEAFMRLMGDPYLKANPNGVVVAEDDGRIVGYAMLAIDELHKLKLDWEIFRGAIYLLGNYFKGKYKNDSKNRDFVKWLVLKSFFEIPKVPKNSAHAHFNLIDGYRNSGLGSEMLLNVYERNKAGIERLGIETVYGIVFSYDEKPEEYFLNEGFEIYDSKNSSMFKRIGKDARLITIVMSKEDFEKHLEEHRKKNVRTTYA